MNNFKVFIFIFATLIAACTPTQRPLQNGQGYVVLPISKSQYRIEYYLKNAKLAETYWNTTAGQLCPDGFQVLYDKKFTLNFDMYVPIAGNNVNLGRQEFIQYGQVVCNGSASNTVMLTESKWKEFNQETRSVTPVSERWLTETLKVHVSHLPVLPVANPTFALEKDWGKPMKRDHRGADTLSIWVKGGDSWYPNYIGLIERNGCLHLVMILPGISAVMMEGFEKLAEQNKGLENLIAGGAIPAYFYPSPAGCTVQ
ncbi:hypothetical protein [Cellvibrio mixtus]|uniref:hypothetical protein n=1 Tax=Cellvibrio mixtus TaxID=39650 RepID=UPI0005873825|nr:hypothetical protein [Cellvibrio mixtus]